MKTLFVHPEDDPEQGAWANTGWDRIVDLGTGGAGTHDRWRTRFGCPVAALDSFRKLPDDFCQVRESVGRGCGPLTDEYGLDWWEIMSILLTAEMETLIPLQRLATTLDAREEIHVSRPGFHASVLRLLLGADVQVFPERAGSGKLNPGRYLRLSANLSKEQVIDVLGDKYDPGYQLRGRFVRRGVPANRSVVLLPTAYVNVSRTSIEYAATFPHEDFLLVATRRSGWVQKPPANVATRWLSSYASVRDRSVENLNMEARWVALKNELAKLPEFDLLNGLGRLADFPKKFRHGFEVRDAWRNVLDHEPVHGVLCADDSNPYTRIPLLLAQRRGLPNIACHHGALDGRYRYKRRFADVIWAKGRMEQDYLVQACAVPPERVELGAPVQTANWNSVTERNDPRLFPYMVFFSEPYEAVAGRPEEFYKDVVPPLADLARTNGRELIVKLHPVESERERTRMLDRILSPEQRRETRVVCGPLTEELLGKMWFGVTVASTVAMECAVRGIPCILCTWLKFTHYGYVEQFIRFGLGFGLESPSEIARIPQSLGDCSFGEKVRENCWHPVAAGRLRELLEGSEKPCSAIAS